MRPYVSIDIETTGLDPTNCQTIEIGAVIDDWVSPIDELQTFRCYVDHQVFMGEAYALSMHADIFRTIATGKTDVRILQVEDVTDYFVGWLIDNGFDPSKEKTLIAGKNFGAFDKGFLEDIYDWKKGVNMKHRFIDPGNMYYIPGVDDGPPSTEECLKRAGLPPVVQHRALDDALDVVHLIRYMATLRMGGSNNDL
jgi:DNA polymerase III alpha subunit (gram-positive type)